ncbi:hypothetical protein ACTIGL_28105 (plasmid) [Bacillus shihchuchen]|uniref:DUF4412 domain-containing protein n=1 Tax=Bacillus shihchuchen TaxID=3036942 RepID=A0ABT7KZ52_9BACI|nr:hypothetical protein [Bacillus shihchuchen]
MKKKHIVTTTALSFGLIALGGVGTTFAADNSAKPSAIETATQAFSTKTIGEAAGQLIFTKDGNSLRVESKNNGKSVSNKRHAWSVRVDGKEIYSFHESMKVEQVVDAFNKLPKVKKQGKQFEVVQKSHEIHRLGSKDGKLTFFKVGTGFSMYAQKSDKSISTEDKNWAVLVDGVIKHTFSEKTPVRDVKASIDKLKLRGQRFELQLREQKSSEPLETTGIINLPKI